MTRKHSKVIKVISVWVAAFALPVMAAIVVDFFAPDDVVGSLCWSMIVSIPVAFAMFMLTLPAATIITSILLTRNSTNKLAPLITYISTYRGRFSQNQIIAELLRAGWTQTQIVEAWKLSK